MSRRAHERMCWLLDRVKASDGFVVAWEVELVNEFLDAFPESQAATRYYSMGAHSCPHLNRAAKRAERLGYLRAGRIGNQDARSYNQRTWARTWRLVMEGWSVGEYEK